MILQRHLRDDASCRLWNSCFSVERSPKRSFSFPVYMAPCSGRSHVFIWGNYLQWAVGPISSAQGMKGRSVTDRKCHCSRSLWEARQHSEEIVRGKPKRKTRKWEFQGQIFDMSWNCTKEWRNEGGETPSYGALDLSSVLSDPVGCMTC